ncbi:MAG: S9 family peptidase [Rhodobacter sp.]|nr:S9 family peptidase [Rhodobacter sp.]MCA3493652.1 S9 family peptidase [Rhodobacter sp.]MCA3500155.1 S9 family peptidase [Rhodobacter sp.]MCA3516585.1 S9 family peptidase [Rhodobacter sp.]
MGDPSLLTFADLDAIHTFRMPNQWCLSADARFLALAVGRPMAQAFAQTLPAGSQPEELDLYWADLSADVPQLSRLLSDTDPALTSFSASWSPDGGYLAFVQARYEPLPDDPEENCLKAQLAVWHRETGVVREIAPVELHAAAFALQALHWTGPRSFVARHLRAPVSPSFKMRRLVQAARQEAGARYGRALTAKVLDGPQPVPMPEPVQQPETWVSHFLLDDVVKVLWDIAVVWDYQGQTSFLIAPDGTSCLIAASGQTGETKLCQISLEGDGQSQQVFLDTGDYVPALNSLAWNAADGSLWGMFDHRSGDHAVLMRRSPGSVDFQRAGTHRFAGSSGEIHVFSDGQVLCREKARETSQISTKGAWFLFDPNKDQIEAIPWLQTSPEAPVHSLPAGRLLVCDSGTAKAFGPSSDSMSEVSADLTGTSLGDARVILPYRGWSTRHLVATDAVVLQGGGSGHRVICVTMDGTTLQPSLAPPGSIIEAVSGNNDNAALAFLLMDQDGSHVMVQRTGALHKVATFNQQIGRKRQARTVFMNAGLDPILPCELILPPDAVGSAPYPVVVHVYPGDRYPPHSRVKAHAPLYPRAHNPHLLAAQGYAVLFPALPLQGLVGSASDFLKHLAEYVDLAIAAASAGGQIDTTRMVLYGHSAGASLALSLLARSQKFRGAIASAGCYNAMGWYGQFDPRDGLDDSTETTKWSVEHSRQTVLTLREPWARPQDYLDTSPWLDAPKLRKPVFLFHGDRDFIPVSQAEQMYSALLLAGSPVRFVRYGGEGHIISGSANVAHLHREISLFLERCLGPGT